MLGVTHPISGKSTVYMATNRVNGKCYVGITNRYFTKRRGDHFATARRGSPTIFHKAIRKYGNDAFKWDILATVDDYGTAKSMEIWLIEQMKPEYNITKGGDGYLGYVPTPQAIEKIRAANIGRPGYWAGKNVPDHVKAAAREGYKNMSPEARERINAGLRRFHEKIRKRIVCVNDGKEFQSIKDAAEFYSVDSSSVAGVCKKKGRFSTHGLVFRYVDDLDCRTAEQVIADGRRKRSPLGRKQSAKKVQCLKTGKVFETVKEASEELGVSAGTVIHMCKGRNKYRAYSGINVAYYQENA